MHEQVFSLRGQLTGVGEAFTGMHEQLSPGFLLLAGRHEQLIFRYGHLAGGRAGRTALVLPFIRRAGQIIVADLPPAGRSACREAVLVGITSVHEQIMELRGSLTGVRAGIVRRYALMIGLVWSLADP